MGRKTDQWVQPATAVRLATVWICVRSAAEMREGDAVAPCWNPLMEGNPTVERWRKHFRKADTVGSDSASVTEEAKSQPSGRVAPPPKHRSRSGRRGGDRERPPPPAASKEEQSSSSDSEEGGNIEDITPDDI